MLIAIERIQPGSPNRLSYQRNDNPGGGNRRNDAALNETITTIASGASKYNATMTHTALRSARQPPMPSPFIGPPP